MLFFGGIDDGYLASFVSEHAPTMAVSSFWGNHPGQNVLVPPSERVARPGVFVIREPLDDGQVKGVVLKEVVLGAPRSL